MGVIYDRGLYEEEVDGDFSIFRKKYTSSDSRSTHFEPVGDMPGFMSNDSDRWAEKQPSAYDPFPFNNYQMSGVGRQDIHSRREEQARNYVAPIVVGIGDILGYSYGYGLGDISWSPFSFSAFPAFAKTTTALNSIGNIPSDLFGQTLKIMKAGPALPTYKGVTTALSFTSLTAPVIADLQKLEFNLTDISGVLKSIVATLTDSKIKTVWDQYDILVKDRKYIVDNLPKPEYSASTNAERVIRIVKNAPDTFTHFNTWAKSFVSLSMDGFKYLRNFSDNVVKTFTDIPGKIQTKFNDLMVRVKSAAQSLIDQVWANMKKYSDAVVNAVTAVVANVTRYVTDISTAITTYISKLMGAIEKDIKYMVSWITTRVKDLVNGIVGDLTSVKDWIMGNITGLSNNIRGNIDKFGTEISNQVKAQLENFKATIDKTKAEVTGQFNDAVGKAKGELTTFVKDVQTQFQGKLDAIEATFRKDYNELSTKIKDATASVTDLMEKTQKVTDLVTALEQKVESYAPRLDTLERWVGQQTGTTGAPTTDSGGAKKGGFFSNLFS